MTVFRMTQDDVAVSCRCGRENILKIEDLELRGSSIYFNCPSDDCPGIGSILVGSIELKNELKKNCQVLVQTLGKRLVKLGKVNAQFEFNENCLAVGKDWVDGDSVEIKKIEYVKKKVVDGSSGEEIAAKK